MYITSTKKAEIYNFINIEFDSNVESPFIRFEAGNVVVFSN